MFEALSIKLFWDQYQHYRQELEHAERGRDGEKDRALVIVAGEEMA